MNAFEGRIGVPFFPVARVTVEITENYRDRGRQLIDRQYLFVTDFERDGAIRNQRVTSFQKAPNHFFEILRG